MDKKPLRQTMPTVAAWIDSLREAFGADAVNPAIRNGAAGGSHFYAEENGHAIGCEAMPGGHVVTVAQMVLAKPDEDIDPRHAKTLAALRAYAPGKVKGAA
jgi:hypothetical protein